MAEVRVWAPHARLVELESNGRIMKMARAEDDWWGLDAPCLRHGTDYAFRLDGEGPLPDPRSAWQPCGVDGLSLIHI